MHHPRQEFLKLNITEIGANLFTCELIEISGQNEDGYDRYRFILQYRVNGGQPCVLSDMEVNSAGRERTKAAMLADFHSITG